MKIYLLSPAFVPPNPCLFPVFTKTFEANGHEFVGRIEDCDVVFFDLHSRISDYNHNDIEYLTSGTLPIVTFCEWDRGNMSKDEWPTPLIEQQRKVFDHIVLRNIESVHFCRLLNKTNPRPDNLLPYERAILHEEKPVSADDLFNREYDVCFIANSSPSREEIKKVFESDGRLKCNIILGQPKIPFNRWIDEARKSKFFIVAGAGGYSCERKQALFSVSTILQEETDQLLAYPFTNGENCIKFSQPPTKKELNIIYEIANDKELLHKIYMNGIDHIKKYYSEESISNYVLEKLRSNWIL